MGFPSLGEYFGSFRGQRPQNVNFRDFFAQKARVSSEPRRLMYNTPQGLQPRSKSWGCKIFQNVPPKDYSNPSRREFMFTSKCTNKFGGRAPPGGSDPLRKFKHFSRHPSRMGVAASLSRKGKNRHLRLLSLYCTNRTLDTYSWRGERLIAVSHADCFIVDLWAWQYIF